MRNWSFNYCFEHKNRDNKHIPTGSESYVGNEYNPVDAAKAFIAKFPPNAAAFNGVMPDLIVGSFYDTENEKRGKTGIRLKTFEILNPFYVPMTAKLILKPRPKVLYGRIEFTITGQDHDSMTDLIKAKITDFKSDFAYLTVDIIEPADFFKKETKNEETNKEN
jgi:hypothetical protein